jgi:general secretion pathway protein H
LGPTGNRVAKVPTLTSGPGNKAPRGASTTQGFTLIELIVVVAIVAIAAALVSLSLPDAGQKRLDEDAARLSALLEGARAQSRATGVPVRWEPLIANDDNPRTVGANDGLPARHFRFDGLPGVVEMPSRWLHEGVVAEVVGARALILGPEPLIGPQRVVLRLDDRRAVLATDGLGPFAAVEDTP